MNNYEDTLAKFDKRMQEKPKLILHPFNATLTLTLKCADDEVAEETLKMVVQHLSRFDDITNVEGSFV